MTTHYIKYKNPIDIDLYSAIKTNKKIVLGKTNTDEYQKIQVGDIIKLWAREGILVCKVTFINKYQTVEAYINKEGVRNSIGIDISIKDTLKIYYGCCDMKKIAELNDEIGVGFIGIGFTFMKEESYHVLNISPVWLNAIKARQKIVEGRPGKAKIAKMKKGDYLLAFNSEDRVYTRLTDVKKYQSFAEMLETNGLENVLPGKNTIDDGVNVYRQWYTPEMEKELGVIGLFIGIVNVI